jgi:dihydropteroate synthase
MLVCGNKSILVKNPIVMGILNISEESFFDGGKYISCNAAIDRAFKMVSEGAKIIDIGAESTKPYAKIISADEELNLLNKIVPILVKEFNNTHIIISIDTYKDNVMKHMLDIGVDMINNIHGFTSEYSQNLIAEYACGACIMHMQNNPRNMQDNPQYINVTKEILSFLNKQASTLQEKGVCSNSIILDPGFGFGKTLQHNIEMMQSFEQFCNTNTGYHSLIGVSRKSFLGDITNRDLSERMPASIACAMIAMQKGVNIIRVHDVKQTMDAVSIYNAIYL